MRNEISCGHVGMLAFHKSNLAFRLGMSFAFVNLVRRTTSEQRHFVRKDTKGQKEQPVPRQNSNTLRIMRLERVNREPSLVNIPAPLVLLLVPRQPPGSDSFDEKR